jgi:hypothetical protein
VDAQEDWTSASDALAGDLLPGERILWAGRPHSHVIFQPSDALIVPLSLLWAGFAIFWEWSVLHTPNAGVSGLFFALWGVPFVLIGVYLVVGRFVVQWMTKRRTYYAVTDRRALVRTGLTGRVLQLADLRRLPTVTKQVRRNGVGTLVFGVEPKRGGWASGWSRFPANPQHTSVPVFRDVHDADSVYRLVMEQGSRE